VRAILLDRENDNDPTLIPLLTPRELEVLVSVAQGFSNKRIAELMGVSASAVATHLARARQKLGQRHTKILVQRVRILAQSLVAVPGLTRAELEVARLACAGLSNRQIAELRACSVYTISNQLSSVYAKLGGGNRRALRAALLEPAGLEQRLPRSSAQRGSSRQNPFVQGTLLQQSAVVSHSCPYAEQVPPVPPVGVPPVLDVPPVPVVPPTPLSGTPPSVITPPQMPLVAPGRMVQGSPRQQSAVVVHAPPAATQLSPPQTNGGSPSGFGTQGRLQQSALEAHAWPT